MASREKELIFHKGHWKEREMLCKSMLWLRHLWSLLKMLLQALDATAMWCFFLILWWAFFAQFFLELSQVTCWSLIFFFFFFFFFSFVWVLTILLDPYNHNILLSSQSIRTRRSSSDSNSQPAALQPYPLTTRVAECPQSFISFLVIHFTLPTFQFGCLNKTIWNDVKTIRNRFIIVASYIRPVIHLL